METINPTLLSIQADLQIFAEKRNIFSELRPFLNRSENFRNYDGDDYDELREEYMEEEYNLFSSLNWSDEEIQTIERTHGIYIYIGKNEDDELGQFSILIAFADVVDPRLGINDRWQDHLYRDDLVHAAFQIYIEDEKVCHYVDQMDFVEEMRREECYA